jgi:hypothetical protein
MLTWFAILENAFISAENKSDCVLLDVRKVSTEGFPREMNLQRTHALPD